MLVDSFMRIANIKKTQQNQKCLLLQDYKYHITNTNNVLKYFSN